ncbi:MAG: pilus assembly protein [Actinobacteria bacterium]|nr:pilus assembly protein [Actinomycetota bacterium]MBW3650913.1 pilus assembly protein [Actinomycetota bacterium]
MIELALVLPLVMAVLLGLFTGGNAYFQKISLVDAVREGARYGASLKHDPGTGGLAAWKQNVIERVVDLSGGQLVPADVCVDLVTPTGSNTRCGVSDPPGAQADPTALAPASLVKVSATRVTTIEAVFFTSTPTLSAKVAARYERDVL